MIPRPPISTRTDTLFPYTTLFRSGCRGAGPEGQQAVDILERKASLLGTLDKSDAPNRFLFEASIPVRIAASRYDQSFTFIVPQRLDGDATLAFDTPDVHGIYRQIGRSSCRERVGQSV